MGRKINKKQVRENAVKQVVKLLDLADSELKDNPIMARDYIQKALKIAMRCNIKIPKRWRNQICSKCLGLIKPGISGRVRLRTNRQTHLTTTCLQCGKIIRQPL